MLGKKKYICQNPKFHNSLNNFGRDPPQEYAWFLGSESGVYFQRRCYLKIFVQYGPMLTKPKKIVNNEKSKILKKKKKMVWRYGG